MLAVASTIVAPLAACGGPSQEPDATEETLTHGCFERHLQDAIVLNKARKSKYEALTDGASLQISSRLIGSERLGIIAARPVDKAARPFQDAGIPIACAEFVSMESVPAFRDKAHVPTGGLGSFHPVDARAVHDALKEAFDRGSFAGLAAKVSEELKAVAEPIEFHCMMRHVLASTLRIANLASEQDARAAQRGLDSTLPISRKLIELHLATISPAEELDEQAAPLQAQGVPILCQDVPDIPPK